jgi:hypothetical protein
MRTFLRGKVTLLFMMLGMLLAIPAVAIADNVQNDVVAGGNDTIVSGDSTTVNYRIAANNGDGETGCNAKLTSPATVTINTPAGVSASPSSLSFTSCGTDKSVTFSSSTVGDHDITVSVSDSGTGTYNVSPAKFTLHVLNPPPPSDTTAPVITPTVAGTLGENGWYTSNVNVSWLVEDGESDISSSTGCDATTISSDNDGTTLTCSATSAGGTSSQSVTIKRDATLPTLNPSVDPNPVLLGESATATANADDAINPGSGLLSSSCDPVVTSSVGSHSVTCYAEDNAGNENSANANYSVIYDFDGFYRPVDNLPTLNTVKAGQSIPVKFSLAGNQGLNIFASGSPASKVAACDASSGTDAIEETVTAGNSSLSYDATADQYNYVWKTEKAWAGTCRQLQVKLADGTTHAANFKLLK